MITKNFLKAAVRLIGILFLLAALTQCTEEETLLQPVPEVASTTPTELDSAAIDSVSAEFVYVVPADARTIDGEALALKPGTRIVLDAATTYGSLRFINIVGTADAPIVITNSGGTATINAEGRSYAMKFRESRHFRVTGGDVDGTYGIRIDGGHLGMSLEYLSTDFEVDHVELYNIGFAGVMAKTDPSCDDATIHGNFTMENVSIHDNYVHETGGEGFYIGNSKYEKGMETPCGVRFPHEIHNVKVYNNVVKNSGWEGIQVGSATQGAEVFNNKVENYGLANKHGQNNGIQIGGGTGGNFYNNIIINGKGNGLIMMGLGDNIVYNNIIVDAGENGIFCDERRSNGPGYQFINNTIINPAKDGIRLYSEEVPRNVVKNNIIINPGSTYADDQQAFVFQQSADVTVEASNNYFSRDINSARFADARNYNFRLTTGSPAIDAGANIDPYGISEDYYGGNRRKGAAYDVGAAEF